MIYCPLECLCSVSQAEAHEKVLKQSKWRDDGGFGDVGGGDGYLVVTFDEVNLAEDGARSCMFDRGYLSGVVAVLSGL